MSALYTCISCRVAFASAEEQRSHFGTDWHRYNMKRRVAELPPLAAATFNEKVLERREQNAVRIDPRSLECSTCRKSFSTENAYRSHVQSKRHRDREAYAAAHPEPAPMSDDSAFAAADQTSAGVERSATPSDSSAEESETDDEGDIEERIASARRRLRRADCLFCTQRFDHVDVNLAHMSSAHSFFIPHRDELSDLGGLLDYLGEKVAEGNLCLYCPNGGKEFGSLEAARRHMIDKAHCKIPFATDEDRAELADFYWQDDNDDGEEWEDASDQEGESPARRAALAGDGLSLMLPSGRILGHRSLKVYYNQRLGGDSIGSASRSRVNDKIIAVRQRLADPSQALISIAGGHGGYGKGLEVMRARNAGEASWAKKQARSHLDQKRREAFRTAVGYKHNNQKHFRDPLLQ